MKTRITALIAVFLLAFSAAFFTGCADGDMTRVTIEIKSDNVAMKGSRTSLISRIMEFFVAPVFAVTGWSSSYDTLELRVTGADIETIIAEIPPYAQSYTVEVPSGTNRTFTVISTTIDGDVPNNWGGQIVAVLAPGTDVKIPIMMLPMSKITANDGSTDIYLSWEDVSHTIVTGYIIYRSDSPNGPYIQILTKEKGTLSDSDHQGLVYGKTYYYKISVNTTIGEGVKSAYSSAKLY